LQALLKGGQNSIVKCDLLERTLQGTKGFSWKISQCKSIPGKGGRKHN